MMTDGDTITLELFDGMKYRITEDPEGYSPAIAITAGGNEMENESEVPIASGELDIVRGDVIVTYTNTSFIPIPTGINVSLIAGMLLMALPVVAIVIIKRKRRIFE